MVQFFRCSWVRSTLSYHSYGAPNRNLCSAFGGLIAFGIQQAHVAIANWRLLFIIEGIPTVLMGLFVILVLPDRPEETSFLDGTERTLQLERMNRGSRADYGRTLDTKHILSAFRDWRVSFIALESRILLIQWQVYAGSVIYFGSNCALASLAAFLPTILKTFGFCEQQSRSSRSLVPG